MSGECPKTFLTREPPRFGNERLAALFCEPGIHCNYLARAKRDLCLQNRTIGATTSSRSIELGQTKSSRSPPVLTACQLAWGTQRHACGGRAADQVIAVRRRPTEVDSNREHGCPGPWAKRRIATVSTPREVCRAAGPPKFEVAVTLESAL